MATASGSSTASAASVTINRRQYPDKTAPLPAQLLRCSMQWRGGDPPRAPPARSQTTIPSNPQTDVFSLRPLMYFLGGFDTALAHNAKRQSPLRKVGER